MRREKAWSNHPADDALSRMGIKLSLFLEVNGRQRRFSPIFSDTVPTTVLLLLSMHRSNTNENKLNNTLHQLTYFPSSGSLSVVLCRSVHLGVLVVLERFGTSENSIKRPHALIDEVRRRPSDSLTRIGLDA